MNKYFRFLLLLTFLSIVAVQASIVVRNESILQNYNLSDYPIYVDSYRASIKDREGEVLVGSNYSYIIYLDNSVLSDNQVKDTLENLASVSNMDSQTLLDKYNNSTNSGKIRRSEINLGAIPESAVNNIKSSTLNFDGLAIVTKTARSYAVTTEDLAHTLGIYSVEGNSSGLEGYYNKTIGNDQVASLQISISQEINQQIFDLFKANMNSSNITAGSFIVLDINSGNRVYSVVNYPSFELSKIIKNEYYNTLMSDASLPILNRAISGSYPTGSIMKPFSALALLENSAITDQTTYFSEGVYELPGGIEFPEYTKQPYGSLNVVEALRKSSNIFFCKAVEKLDYNLIANFQSYIGLGKFTGIDLVGEESGNLASPMYKKNLGQNWYLGDSCNSIIGQGYNLLTPIQMVRSLSAILTNKSCSPKVVKSIQYKSGQAVELTSNCSQLNIEKSNIEIVKKGMRAAAINVGFSSYDIGLKTGTAEVSNLEKPHVWVLGFYPYEEPRYAFVTMAENGDKTRILLDFIKTILDKQYLI